MLMFYKKISSRFSAKNVLSAIRLEMDNLVADLSRETEHDVALLESRIASLKALIDEADRRILLAERESVKREREREVLDRMADEARSSKGAEGLQPQAPVNPMSQGLESPRQPLAGTVVAHPDRAGQPERQERPERNELLERSERSERPANPTTYSRAQVLRNSRKEEPSVTRASRVEPLIPLAEQVVSLAQKGLSPELIASRLAVSLGEVELIIDMRLGPSAAGETR